jgi:hypothetical protein
MRAGAGAVAVAVAVAVAATASASALAAHGLVRLCHSGMQKVQKGGVDVEHGAFVETELAARAQPATAA